MKSLKTDGACGRSRSLSRVSRLTGLLLAIGLVLAACASEEDPAEAEQDAVAAGAEDDGEADAEADVTDTTEPDEDEDPASQVTEEPVLDDEYSQEMRRASDITVDTSEYAADPPYSIATIVQGPTNGWGTIFDAVMNHELEQSGLIEDQLYVPWDFTTESQANGIDDAISRGVDAILLTSLSRAGLADSVDRANEAGIPVITCMAGVATESYTVEVSRNMPAMGYSSAEWLAERLDGEGNIAMMHGIPGVDAAELWRDGALAALEQYPGIEILAEDYANWSVADATTAMRTIMQQHPELDGLWFGGMEMALGGVNAYIQDGREIPPIGGTGPANGFLRIAEEQDIEFFVSPFPPAGSQLCVETLFDVLDGEPVQKFIDVKDLMDGTAPFGTGHPEAEYLPQFDDEFIGPVVVDESVYLDAGFGS